MIIIGSFTSANSKRLTQLSLDINPQSYQVTDSHDLQSLWFENKNKIGISAGASTPDYLIEEVKNVNGTFISLWHNDTFSNYKQWEGWESVYKEMIKVAKS